MYLHIRLFIFLIFKYDMYFYFCICHTSQLAQDEYVHIIFVCCLSIYYICIQILSDVISLFYGIISKAIHIYIYTHAFIGINLSICLSIDLISPSGIEMRRL